MAAQAADKQNDELMTDLAGLFKMFSDPTRVKILNILLEGEKCVGDVAAQMNMSTAAVSHHLRHAAPGKSRHRPSTRQRGLLRARRRSRHVDSLARYGTRDRVGSVLAGRDHGTLTSSISHSMRGACRSCRMLHVACGMRQASPAQIRQTGRRTFDRRRNDRRGESRATFHRDARTAQRHRTRLAG